MPTLRNLSTIVKFHQMAKKHRPKFRFSGSSRSDWENWKRELMPEVEKSLGLMPEEVPLNPQILAEWTEDGLIKQKIIFDVEDGLSATAYLFRPTEINGKLPCILACHGHGPFGKDGVMGNYSRPELRANTEVCNYDYGLKMAKAGYAVIAIDWRGFGERDDRNKPTWINNIGSRDICNMLYLRANMFGMTLLGMDIHDGKCALDYLCSQDFVDADRIGVMGLSFGGTMTTWMALIDDRIKAADIVCYSNHFSDFAIRDGNFCGSQMIPGLYQLCDVPDLHGLIAPKPLLVEIGAYDNCFLVGSAMSCFREVEKIYTAAGCPDKLELDLFEGGHRWAENKTLDFFKKYL